MAIKTNNDVIRRNGGAHVALMIMKMYKRPVTLDQFTEISAKKLAVRHRGPYLARLVNFGYAVKTSESPQMFQITQKGIDKIFELAIPPLRSKRPARVEDSDD